MTETAIRSGLGDKVRTNWYLIALLAVCLVRMWLMPLPSSYWGDEAATVMLIQHPEDPSFRAAPQLSATLYNVLPRVAQMLSGNSEVAYRLPSLIMAFLALAIIGRIAARLISPDAAWFAVFACLAIPSFNFYAVDARPYALGIFVTVAGVWMLIRWLDSGAWSDASLFAVCAALLWRVHPAFWAFYPVFLIYALVCLARGDRRAGWIQAMAVCICAGASLIPVALFALSLFHQPQTHIVTPVPSLRYLAETLSWKLVSGTAAAAMVARLLFRRRPGAEWPGLAAVFAVTLWWLGMPALLFGFARLSATGIFMARYVSPALPGAALAAAATAAFFLPPSLWKPASALLALAALAIAGRWGSIWPLHNQYEDWRGLARLADLAALQSDTPVIAPSYFVEAVRPNWSSDYKVPGFLYAPLYAYPVRGRVYPFPFSTNKEDEVYAAHLSTETLSRGDRFLVYGSANAFFWVKFFLKRPELAGWHVTYKQSGLLVLAVFDRLGVSGIGDGDVF